MAVGGGSHLAVTRSLALCSEIVSDCAWEPYGGLKIKPRLVACKTNTLLNVLFFWLPWSLYFQRVNTE